MAKKSYVGVGNLARTVKRAYIGVANPEYHDLPSGYKEVNYIELNTNSIINTGYVINNEDITVEFKLRCENLETNPFGSSSNSDTNWCNPYTTQYGWDWYVGDSTKLFRGAMSSLSSTYEGTFQTESGNATLTLTTGYTNTVAYEGTIINGDNNPIALGGIILNGVASRMLGDFYIYYFRIKVGGSYVRNLVPCYNESTNAVGVYDLANNTFITNYGSGTITRGDDAYPSTARTVKRAYIGVTNPKYHNLPSEYQEVEFLQSSGTQYINTGLSNISDLGVDMDFEVVGFPDTINRLFGYVPDGYATSTARFWVDYRSSNVFSIVWSPNVGAGYVDYSTTISVGSEFNIKLNYLNDGLAKVNDTTVSSDVGSGTVTGPIYLFDAWISAGVKRSAIKLKKTIITSGSTILRNLIPCYRKSDSVAGMYDLVNDVFYTNAGTGTFAVGDDVYPSIARRVFNFGLPREYQEVEYILLNTNSIINTGYVINSEDIKIDFKARCYYYSTNPFGSSSNADSNWCNPYFTEYGWDWYVGSSQTLFRGAMSSRATVYAGTLTITSSTARLQVTEGSTYDNTVSHTGTIINGDNNPIALGGVILNGVASRMTGGHYWYYFKVTVGDSLVLNLVPCYRKSDSVVGMYDLVSDTFITNYGTGTITPGGDV